MYYVFCTIIDKYFLFKGLTLYSSLQKHCKHFRLYVLCMDEIVYGLLSRMDLPGLELIKLEEIEDERLLSVKSNRTTAEYCWTCKPYLCLHVLQQRMADSVVYLDADLFFFSDPYPMYEEIADSSIAIIKHRFPVEAYTKKVGRFNSGFVCFRRDKEGLQCLGEWQEDVIEWCFNRFEENRSGDQFYLNKWPARFNHLLSIKHPGVNVAPWNVKYSKVEEKDGQLYVNDEPLIFYHFQSFHLLSENRYREVLGYFMPHRTKKLIYKPYVEALLETVRTVKRFDEDYSFGYQKLSFKSWLRDFVYYRILPEKIHFQVARIRQQIYS
jgi:hypothetical protein